MPPKRPAAAASEAPNKKFKCAYQGCQKDFAFQSHMDRHVNNVHLRVMHRCSYENCEKEYTSESNLTTHIDSVHKGVRFHCSCVFLLL